MNVSYYPSGKGIWIHEYVESPIREEFLTDVDGNQITGLAIDLLIYLMQTMNFTVQLSKPLDNTSYGVLQSDGSWTGCMGTVVNGEVDFSIAILSVTSSRAKGIVEIVKGSNWKE